MATQNICNICGAEYEYRDGKWRCPACGAYKPEEISGEEETLLYNAAQKLRLGVFDDAEELYRDITRQYPKNSRGYWGLVLAKYGIIYERDYDGKMVPSCYATKYESISGDDNYKKALQYADSDNKKYYLTQANLIEEVRRKWIEIAEREEPYDVFISYKDSDKENNIERTQDSFDAYELYVFLKDRGYRVFFSRESLRGKEGDKYEPYIFNALNTAQVMIVYGSKPEYIESTWVKNEWMRYYKRIRHGDKQDNSLILAYKGFNPSKLPKPLCDIQGVDLGRAAIGFGDIEAKVSEILINAKKRQKMVRRTVKVRREQTSEKLQKIETKEIGRVAVVPKAERERVAVRAIGAKTLKLSASAENTLNVAQGYLERGDFAEAAERFKSVLGSSPRNGRALTGVLLAGSVSVSIDAFVNGGAANLSDMSLLEKVLGCAEKDVAEKILQAVCRDVERSLSAGDVMRAKQIVAVIREYDDVSVDKMRRGLFDAGLKLLPSDEHSARYFIDINLDFEEDNRTYIKKLHTAVSRAISCGKFDTAKYWLDALKNTDPASFDTQVCLIEAEYKVKSADEVLNQIESEKAYSRAEDIIALLDRPSAEKWLGICLDEASYLIDSERFGGAQRWIEMCAKYNFESREAKLKELLEKCIKRASEKSAECFESLLTYVADGNDTVYVKNALEFAASARSGGNFSCAKIYYGKALAVWPDCIPAARGRFYADIGCADEQQLPEKIGNISDWTCFEDVLAVQKDDADDLFWIKKLAKACIDNVKEYKLSAAKKIFEVFEKLLSYIPEKSESDMLVLLGNMADLCLSEGLFDEAGRFYSMYIGEDSECSAAYWGLLSAKLKCRNEEELVKQPKPLSEFEEFENAQLCAAGNKPLLNHYMDVREKQTAHIKKAKRRSRAIKISAIALSAAVVAGGAVGGFLAYYNSQSGLVYSENNGGYVVSAGKFYNAGERLVIPEEYNGKPVIAIGKDGFAEHTEIEELVLSDNIVRIEEGAFAECSNLTEVTISSSNVRAAQEYYSEGGNLEYIGGRAFEGCSSLAAFSFEYGLEYVGTRAFSDAAFVQVSLPCTVSFVGSEAFYNCKNLAEIVVGDREEIPSGWAENWNAGCNASVDFRLRVVLDYNGATSGTTVGEEYISYGKDFVLPVPERKGYSFDGWYSGDTRLTDGFGRGISSWQSQSGGILTAKWSANINTLNFNANGGEGTMSAQEIVTDETASISANTFTRKGYTFVGWSTTPNGSAIYTDQSQYTMGTSSSYTLYAVWRANRYNIELNANGGTTEADNVQIAFGSQYTLPLPVLDGYNFLGWYDGTEETATAYTDDGGDSLATWSFTESKTLYAHWQRVRFTITLNYEGAAENADTEFIYVWTGNEYFLPVPSRENCEFVGWYSEADGNGTLIADEQGNGVGVWSGESDIVAYALWYEYTEGLMYELNDDDGYTLTGISDKNIDEVVIPQHYNGKPVTQIAETALQNCINMRSLTVPSTVTEIAGGALYGCGSLEVLTLPFIGASREAYGEQALLGYLFGKEEYMNSVQITQRVSISNSVDFYVPASLKNIAVTDARTIGVGALSYINSLESVSLSVGITSIGQNAFYGCSYLNSVNIPEGVDSIGNLAFSCCESLTSVTIPKSVKTISSQAFFSCDSLTIYCEVENRPTGWDYNWNDKINLPNGIPAVWDCNNNNVADDGNIYAVVEGIRYSLSGSTATVVRQAISLRGEYNIPSTIVYDGQLYNVRNILASAFSDCRNLVSIVIPESVTSIGDYTFYNCSSLTCVTIPESVTSIGDRAFCGCSSLMSITIQEGVTSIGDSTFYNCSSLMSITIPESVTSIGDRAFYGCSSLMSITIPKGITSIGDYTFYNCSSLTDITIPEGVTSIGNSTFDNCSGLTNITLPEGITDIGAAAFYGCSSLTNIIIPESVTGIGGSSFEGCSNLTSIVIPEGVSGIGYGVFRGCNSLTEITIPNSVTIIEQDAFEDCDSLTIYCEAASQPSGWVSFWNGACPVVWDCNNNSTDNDGNVYAVIDGIRYGLNSGNATIIRQPSCLSGEIIIPSSVTYEGELFSVTNIESYAFDSCSNPIEITIPESLTSIGEETFAGCSGLVSITIPESVTRIGAAAFWSCSNLINIVIPESVTAIESSAFLGCNSLSSITIPDSVTSMGRNVFGSSCLTIYCEAPSRPNGWDGSWKSYTFRSVVWDCLNNDIAEDGYIYCLIDGIRYGIIDGEAKIVNQPTSIAGDLILPSTITYDGQTYNISSIEDNAFSDCNGLTSVVISESIRDIGNWAFGGCASLTSVIILNGAQRIGAQAFYGCSNLTSITIPDSVTEISGSAFYNCSNLINITIPTSVTEIGGSAFYGCTGLTSIIIPESVISIEDYAFSECSNITIYCEAKSQPDGWGSNWNPDGRPVVWGYEVQ